MPTKKEPWFSVSIEGLKKTLARKGKSVCLYELVQNAWDTDATSVEVTLAPIDSGVSVLSCIDNSTAGFSNLESAHEMFKESAKESAGGRVPNEIEFVCAEIPDELRARLIAARSKASGESLGRTETEGRDG